MINTLGDFLEIIKVATGKKEPVIAKEIGKNASYLRSIKKTEAAGSPLVKVLYSRYQKDIQHFVRLLQTYIETGAANSIEITASPLEGFGKQSTVQMVSVAAIERLKEKIEKAFAEELGKTLEEEVGKKVQKGKPAKTGKLRK